MSQFRIAVVVGSLRRESHNKALATALAKLGPSDFTFEPVEIGDLPLYNQDDDGSQAPQVLRLKAAISAAAGVIFVTPEYNRSIPGALKNAIDWGTRPYGTNAFTRKCAAVIGASPGAIGTSVAQQHLRSLLGFCNAPQMNAPEAYIQFKPGLIDDEGNVSVDATREFLQKFMADFHTFIVRVRSVLPLDSP